MRLFLDDERFPAQPERWVVVRSVAEAKTVLELLGLGMLDSLSLDHDLGDGPDGADFVRWLCWTDMDGHHGRLPNTLWVRYHSQNPIGAENMRQYLSLYCRLHRDIELIET